MTTFSDVPLLQEIFQRHEKQSLLSNRIFWKLWSMVNNFWITTGIFFFSSACSHWLLQGHVTPRLKKQWTLWGRFLFIPTKPFEIWKQEQVVQKFPGKSFQKFRKLLNFQNVNHSTENSRNSEREKLNGRKTSGRKFSKISVYVTGCPVFWKFWKMPFHSLLETERKFKQDFLVEWKLPSFFSSNPAFQGVKHTTFLWSRWLAWLLARSLPTQKYEQVQYCIHQWTVLYLSFGKESAHHLMQWIRCSLVYIWYNMLRYAILRYMVLMQWYDMINN